MLIVHNMKGFLCEHTHTHAHTHTHTPEGVADSRRADDSDGTVPVHLRADDIQRGGLHTGHSSLRHLWSALGISPIHLAEGGARWVW